MLDKEVFSKIIMDRVNELREKHGFSEHTPYTRLLVNSLAVYMLDDIENFNESDPNYTWNKETLEAIKAKNYVGFALCYADMDIDRELICNVLFSVTVQRLDKYWDIPAILKSCENDKPLAIEDVNKYGLTDYLTKVWSVVYCEAWKQLLAPLQNYLLD